MEITSRHRRSVAEQLADEHEQGYKRGARETSARIRRELPAAINDWALRIDLGGHVGDRAIGVRATLAAVMAALDRICPPEGE